MSSPMVFFMVMRGGPWSWRLARGLGSRLREWHPAVWACSIRLADSPNSPLRPKCAKAVLKLRALLSAEPGNVLCRTRKFHSVRPSAPRRSAPGLQQVLPCLRSLRLFPRLQRSGPACLCKVWAAPSRQAIRMNFLIALRGSLFESDAFQTLLSVWGGKLPQPFSAGLERAAFLHAANPEDCRRADPSTDPWGFSCERRLEGILSSLNTRMGLIL